MADPKDIVSTDVAALGAAVRALRRAQGLTQGELGLAAGTGRRFVGDLERGKPTCRLGEAFAVLAALGAGLRLEAE
jgi:y4mF family transcriptional regulator